jgi:hypothetical protein
MERLLQLVCLVAVLSSGKCESCGPISPEDIKLIFIKDLDSKFQSFALKDADKFLLDPASFNRSKQTVLYLHDFLENADSMSAQKIAYPFLKRGDFNVLILDTGKFFGGNYYFDAVPNAVKVSESERKFSL